MERIGARANATTWFDRTNYATMPSEYVSMAIELEADRMRGLLIREEYRLRNDSCRAMSMSAVKIAPYAR